MVDEGGRNILVEFMDLDSELFRVLEYRVRAESGGAGRHRGRMGFGRRYLITRDHVTLATYGDRFVFAPPGIFGGHPGERAAPYVLRNGEQTRSDRSRALPSPRATSWGCSPAAARATAIRLIGPAI